MRPICRFLSPAVVVAASLASGLGTIGCVDLVGAIDGRYVEREEKHFTVNGRADVSVSTFDGSVDVRGWARNVAAEKTRIRPKNRAKVARRVISV